MILRPASGNDILLDEVRLTDFPITKDLAPVGLKLRYKFMRYDHNAKKWVDATAYTPYSICKAQGALHVEYQEADYSMLQYEDISNTNNTKAIYSADKIIAQGWVRRNYPILMLDKPIPWVLDKPDLRSWNFYIHCFDMLDPLLKAYSETRNLIYLNTALPIALDWSVKHKDNTANGLSPFSWYDMSVGMRAYRLAYLLDAGDAAGLLSEDIKKVLWDSLEQHAQYLADDKNIAFHNNHGYYQVAGQLAMGRRFAHASASMAQALEQGKFRLKAMLQQQFAEDGVHREHSPDYHRMVYDTLRALISSGLVDEPEIIEFALRIEETLSWFVLPNQHVANFGDSDFRLMRRKPAEAERKWQTPEMQYVVSGGKLGCAPKKNVMAFEQGGYFVARKLRVGVDFSNASYLAQMAAFHSRTHKHADDLSFIWSEYGADILVDAGRYGYIGKAEQGSALWKDGHWYSDPNRVYCESTRAHNTLEFDGLNFPRKSVKPYGSALHRWGEQESGLVFVETECKQFASIRHARVLVLMPGKWLLAFDWFHDNESHVHDVRQWFHLGHELQLHLDQGGFMTGVPGCTQPLRVMSLLAEPISSRSYLGEEKPVMQGWWSAKERDIVPNYAFCYELKSVVSGTFATLFSFSNHLSADASWSKINVSGRKGQLRWKDESGVHELRLDRPADGQMNIIYAVR